VFIKTGFLRDAGLYVFGLVVAALVCSGCQTTEKASLPKEDAVMNAESSDHQSTPVDIEDETRKKTEPSGAVEVVKKYRDQVLDIAPVEPLETHPLLPYQRIVLDNGMKIILKEVHSAPIVAVDIWVGTGAADEDPARNGIAHFLEHMFFKGTEKRPVGQMDLEIKELGGYNNAATSYDYTHYYVVLPSEHYLKALDILSDAVLNATFPEEEIQREREVVLREIDRKEDSPWGKLYTEFLEKVFEGHPYGRPILGTPETLAGIDRQTFLDYVKENYQPGNLVLSIVGDVHSGEALAAAEKIFGHLPGKPLGNDPLPPVPKPEQPQEFTILKDVQTAYLIIGYPTETIRGSTDEYALDVAASILGEGRSSWLYQLLKEDLGLVTDAESFFWTLEHAGLFGLEAGCDPDDLPKVEKILFEQLKRLRRGDFSDADIQKAKNQITSDFAYSTEKAASIAGTLAEFEITASIEDAVFYSDRIRAITREDIIQALERHLKPDSYTKGVLKPHPRS
jgi:zinc protease